MAVAIAFIELLLCVLELLEGVAHVDLMHVQLFALHPIFHEQLLRSPLIEAAQ